MAKEDWMPKQELLETVAENLAPDIELSFRPMFGGAGGYTKGRVFACMGDMGLALKLPEEGQERLLKEPGAAQLQFDPTMPPSKHYVLVPPEYLSDVDRITPWVEESIRYAQTLPLPKKRK